MKKLGDLIGEFLLKQYDIAIDNLPKQKPLTVDQPTSTFKQSSNTSEIADLRRIPKGKLCREFLNKTDNEEATRRKLFLLQWLNLAVDGGIMILDQSFPFKTSLGCSLVANHKKPAIYVIESELINHYPHRNTLIDQVNDVDLLFVDDVEEDNKTYAKIAYNRLKNGLITLVALNRDSKDIDLELMNRANPYCPNQQSLYAIR